MNNNKYMSLNEANMFEPMDVLINFWSKNVLNVFATLKGLNNNNHRCNLWKIEQTVHQTPTGFNNLTT